MSEVHRLRTMCDVRTARDIWRRHRPRGMEDVQHEDTPADQQSLCNSMRRQLRREETRFRGQEDAVLRARRGMLHVRDELALTKQRNAVIMRDRELLEKGRSAREKPWKHGYGPEKIQERWLERWR